MEPRPTADRGRTEPFGLDAETTRHGLADRSSEGIALRFWCKPHERGQVPVFGRLDERTRHDHDRISTQVGKDRNSVPNSIEMLSEY